MKQWFTTFDLFRWCVTCCILTVMTRKWTISRVSVVTPNLNGTIVVV